MKTQSAKVRPHATRSAPSECRRSGLDYHIAIIETQNLHIDQIVCDRYAPTEGGHRKGALIDGLHIVIGRIARINRNIVASAAIDKIDAAATFQNVVAAAAIDAIVILVDPERIVRVFRAEQVAVNKIVAPSVGDQSGLS